MSAPLLITFDKIWKGYGEGEARVLALAGVDLAIRKGEFVAIMGPSGSGKSTAMNIIGCLDTPTAGTYRFMGVDAGRLGRNRRALLRNLYVGFVFQGYNLLPRTTAAENVELPLIYRGVSARERRHLAMQALAQVVTKPTLLVADEPTGNLDTARTHEIMELLTRLNAELGLTIVMVTHEADVAEYAERTVRFLDGHVASDTAKAEAA
ncbi:MAG: ABC transporter ATP-binding protein [Mesorhizobium sp.]|nr:MAG: ABC transporter ATP-binding protein [Mesorhizobium sp.]